MGDDAGIVIAWLVRVNDVATQTPGRNAGSRGQDCGSATAGANWVRYSEA